MARRVNAWECGHCGKLYKTEKPAVRHEKACLNNPDGKNCLMCDNKSARSGMPWCKVGHGKCSRAVSANCKDFERMKLHAFEGNSDLY